MCDFGNAKSHYRFAFVVIEILLSPSSLSPLYLPSGILTTLPSHYHLCGICCTRAVCNFLLPLYVLRAKLHQSQLFVKDLFCSMCDFGNAKSHYRFTFVGFVILLSPSSLSPFRITITLRESVVPRLFVTLSICANSKYHFCSICDFENEKSHCRFAFVGFAITLTCKIRFVII